ncbi:MAG TPA: hypothetical protein VFN02_12400, partial [Ktedonobacteraceae bacterium]|nr:hypothetical protein [Ktedonobacteraceae bacterium]
MTPNSELSHRAAAEGDPSQFKLDRVSKENLNGSASKKDEGSVSQKTKKKRQQRAQSRLALA